MLVKLSQLPEIRKKHSGKRIVLAGGTFDLLHKGHVKFLEKVKNQGDITVVAVCSDERVKFKKGPNRPIISEKERVFLVDSLKGVDYTMVLPKPFESKIVRIRPVLKHLNPEVLVSIEKDWELHRKELESFGTQLKIVPRLKNFSTSKIIGKITNQIRS